MISSSLKQPAKYFRLLETMSATAHELPLSAVRLPESIATTRIAAARLGDCSSTRTGAVSMHAVAITPTLSAKKACAALTTSASMRAAIFLTVSSLNGTLIPRSPARLGGESHFLFSSKAFISKEAPSLTSLIRFFQISLVRAYRSAKPTAARHLARYLKQRITELPVSYA